MLKQRSKLGFKDFCRPLTRGSSSNFDDIKMLREQIEGAIKEKQQDLAKDGNLDLCNLCRVQLYISCLLSFQLCFVLCKIMIFDDEAERMCAQEINVEIPIRI